MTVQLETLSQTYACNGSTVAFGVPFKFDDPAYVKVWHLPATGSGAALAQPGGFAVVAAGAGWSVVTVATYPAGDTLTVYRDSDPVQVADFSDGEGFDAPTMDGALDRLARQIAETKAGLLRSVRLPPGMDGGFDPRAHLTTFLGIDSAGNLDFTAKAFASPSDLAAAALLILQPELDAAVAAVIASINTQVAAATAAANAAANSASSALASQLLASTAMAAAQAAAASAQAAASSASSAAGLAQQWASKRGTTVDGVNYSAAENAAQAAGYASAAGDAATSADADATAADASASLAALISSAPVGQLVPLPDGSTIQSALSWATQAAQTARAAAGLPVLTISDTSRRDGTNLDIISNVLTAQPLDLFREELLTNAGALALNLPGNVWTTPSLDGSDSMAAIVYRRLGAAVTFAAVGGTTILTPSPLIASGGQWWAYRNPNVAGGGAGDIAQDRTLSVTVSAGTNRVLVFQAACCYLTTDPGGGARTCTLAGTGLTVTQRVTAQGSGYYNATDPGRLDMWSATLADSSVATTHTLTFHTPADLLTFAALITAFSNVASVAVPGTGYAQAPAAGHADIAATPGDASNDVVVFAGFGQGNSAKPVTISRGTAIPGNVTGGTAKKDIAYAGSYELRSDASAQTTVATPAVVVPAAALSLVLRRATSGSNALHTRGGLVGIASGGVVIAKAHSNGLDWYLEGDLA